jgi:predicted acetyltransferase
MTANKISNVTLAEAPAGRTHAIANLLQLYLHDFSEFAAVGTPHGEVDDDGRFAYARLDDYWREEGRIALTIEADGRLAGFALINRWSALNRPIDHSVAEFFVLRKYRRLRVGSRAAKLLFERFPGCWEAPIAWYNQPALAFWRHAVAACGAEAIEERTGDGKRWVGPVLCFETKPAVTDV